MQPTIDKLRTILGRPARLSGLALMTLCIAATVDAQSFTSGSTGLDGDLLVNAGGVTTFTATPVGGGNVYNFHSITIAQGSTLRLSGSVFSRSAVFSIAAGCVGVWDDRCQRSSRATAGDLRAAHRTDHPWRRRIRRGRGCLRRESGTAWARSVGWHCELRWALRREHRRPRRTVCHPVPGAIAWGLRRRGCRG